MAKSNADTMLSDVARLLSERQSVASKERRLIKQLSGVLRKMGYQVVPQRKVAARRKKRRRGRKAKVVRLTRTKRRVKSRRAKRAA